MTAPRAIALLAAAGLLRPGVAFASGSIHASLTVGVRVVRSAGVRAAPAAGRARIDIDARDGESRPRILLEVPGAAPGARAVAVELLPEGALEIGADRGRPRPRPGS